MTDPSTSPARRVGIYPAMLIGLLSHVYLIDGRHTRRLPVNMWSIVDITTTTSIGCTSASLSWGRIARGNQTRLPVLSDAIVYRPHWLQPTVFEGSAEPYNTDDRSLRARLRRVPPPPTMG